ncbi:MAG: Peptidase protein, partial [Chloroflexota bacterium]|nr:Peptidase protein [Chloroflexota bacterium]
MLTPLVILLGVVGGAWGFAADRIAARWPAHDDGSVRPIDWRTPVVVIVGALSLGALTVR